MGPARTLVLPEGAGRTARPARGVILGVVPGTGFAGRKAGERGTRRRPETADLFAASGPVERRTPPVPSGAFVCPAPLGSASPQRPSVSTPSSDGTAQTGGCPWRSDSALAEPVNGLHKSELIARAALVAGVHRDRARRGVRRAEGLAVAVVADGVDDDGRARRLGRDDVAVQVGHQQRRRPAVHGHHPRAGGGEGADPARGADDARSVTPDQLLSDQTLEIQARPRPHTIARVARPRPGQSETDLWQPSSRCRSRQEGPKAM
jgi:hypothetical protein